jgi:predicted Fe-Mo cluster-binding NifX family protein
MVDSRFGRAAFFAVYDDVTTQWNFVPNQQNLQAAQGAGTQAAQTVIDVEADVLIAANVGPKAMAALQANGISVFQTITSMTVQQALEAFQNGRLKEIQDSNVEGHWV